MEIFLDGYHPVKKMLYKVAAWGLFPTIISAIGFAYIGAPSSIQVVIRRYIPFEARVFLLKIGEADSWLIALFVLTIFFVIWGSVGSQVTVRLVTRNHKKVLSENNQLKEESNSKNINCFNLFSNYLYSYAVRFDLGVDERVSLYKLDMHMFSCIGRYSENEVFKSKPSRLYPINQGCIAKAWEKGSFRSAVAPDPKVNFDDWKKFNIASFNFDNEQLDSIRMRSRVFYAMRLQNAQNVTVAVLVFESLNPDGLPFGKIERFFKKPEPRNIVSLIESLEGHIPSLEDARMEGF